MKTLITGDTDGQLNWELRRTKPNWSVIEDSPEFIDFTKVDAIGDYIKSSKPELIINAAAYTAVDKAESETDKAYRINSGAVSELATSARSVSAFVVHVSTDFVYGPVTPVPIDANTQANPVSVYGKSKLEGDSSLNQIMPDTSAVVRTAWLYSSHGNNFVKTMLRLMSERDEVGVVSDQVGTPTWAHSLADAIWIIAEKRISGFQHWTAAGSTTWYEFAVAIYEEGQRLGLLDPNCCVVKSLKTSEYPTVALRPDYSVLEMDKTVDKVGVVPNPWRSDLVRMMEELV